MKKNLLLLLLSSSLLVGCDFKLFNSNSKPDNTNQNTEDHKDEQHTDDGGNTGDDTGGNTETEEKEELLQEYTATIKTSGTDLTSNFGDRVQFDNSNYSHNGESLMEYFDGFLEYLDLIKSLTFTGYVQTLDADLGSHLCLGSSKNSGSMTWTSIVKIYKVQFTVVNYYKSYSYTGNSGITVDNNAHFLIDSDDHSLELAAGVTPVYSTFSKEYSEGTSSFTIASSGGRVLIKEMTITWRG